MGGCSFSLVFCPPPAGGPTLRMCDANSVSLLLSHLMQRAHCAYKTYCLSSPHAPNLVFSGTGRRALESSFFH